MYVYMYAFVKKDRLKLARISGGGYLLSVFTNLDVPSVYRDTAQQAVPATLPRAETATATKVFLAQ